jgi:hypothetical protein
MAVHPIEIVHAGPGRWLCVVGEIRNPAWLSAQTDTTNH